MPWSSRIQPFVPLAVPSLSSTSQTNNNKTKVLVELSELTGQPRRTDHHGTMATSPDESDSRCKKPLVYINNRVYWDEGTNYTIHHELRQSSLIPKLLHLTFKNRCVPQDFGRHVQRWKEALPSYSVFFHDDKAVDELLRQEHWPEFPHLAECLQCVRSGAMKIDLWRVLVLYKYGGIYTDIDNWPLDKFDESLFDEKNLSAFSFSDFSGRPSQWFLALEPRHPIAYFAMIQILQNIYEIPDVSKPKVVFTTGPGAFVDGFRRFLHGIPDALRKEYLVGMGGKIMRKIPKMNETDSYIRGGYNFSDMVPLYQPPNDTRPLNYVKRRQRIEIEGAFSHWPDDLKKQVRQRKYRLNGPCRDILMRNQNASKVLT